MKTILKYDALKILFVYAKKKDYNKETYNKAFKVIIDNYDINPDVKTLELIEPDYEFLMSLKGEVK